MNVPFVAAAKTMSFIITRDRALSVAFYGGVLGFSMISEDDFAVVFDSNGTMLRISTVPTHEPAAHTVLGWEVTDIMAAVNDLSKRGVKFTVYEGLGQDSLGIWKVAGTQVAWFFDPDGNNLSITQF